MNLFFNNFIEKQAVNMMPVNHVHTLTAGDLTATGIIVNKHFLKVTYRTFKEEASSIRTANFLDDAIVLLTILLCISIATSMSEELSQSLYRSIPAAQ